jgi:hypothetical protein
MMNTESVSATVNYYPVDFSELKNKTYKIKGGDDLGIMIEDIDRESNYIKFSIIEDCDDYIESQIEVESETYDVYWRLDPPPYISHNTSKIKYNSEGKPYIYLDNLFKCYYLDNLYRYVVVIKKGENILNIE